MMSLHGKPCITGVSDCTSCINSRLLIAINWQNWVKLQRRVCCGFYTRRTTQTTTTLPTLPRLTTPHYPVVVLLDLNSALTVECDEAGIRQIASWETQSATGGPLGASRTRSTRPNPDVIGPLQFSPLLEYDHDDHDDDDDDDLQSSKEDLINATKP